MPIEKQKVMNKLRERRKKVASRSLYRYNDGFEPKKWDSRYLYRYNDELEPQKGASRS